MSQTIPWEDKPVEIDDVVINDTNSGTRVTFRYSQPEHDWSFEVPRRIIGRLSEKLHDHINKGDNNG